MLALTKQGLLKRVLVGIGVGVIVWTLSHMVVFHFGSVRMDPEPVTQKILLGVYPIVHSSLENLGEVVYGTMPFGRVEYIFSGPPRGLRLAVFSSFTLWDESWIDFSSSVIFFILKLSGLNAVGVLLVLHFRQRAPVNGAWVEFVRRKRAYWSFWFPALAVAAMTITVSNLAWMLWHSVHSIHRAQTDAPEQFFSQGEAFMGVRMESWTPVALGAIPIATIAIGGIALYFVVTSLLFDWMAARGAQRLGLCGKCGYRRDGDGASVCPECGFGGTLFKSRGRVAVYCLGFGVCLMLFAAPMWMGWFAHYLHQGLYLYFAS